MLQHMCYNNLFFPTGKKIDVFFKNCGVFSLVLIKIILVRNKFLKKRNQHFPEKMCDFGISLLELHMRVGYEVAILNFCKYLITLYITKGYCLEIRVTTK